MLLQLELFGAQYSGGRVCLSRHDVLIMLVILVSRVQPVSRILVSVSVLVSKLLVLVSVLVSKLVVSVSISVSEVQVSLTSLVLPDNEKVKEEAN